MTQCQTWSTSTCSSRRSRSQTHKEKFSRRLTSLDSSLQTLKASCKCSHKMCSTQTMAYCSMSLRSTCRSSMTHLTSMSADNVVQSKKMKGAIKQKVFYDVPGNGWDGVLLHHQSRDGFPAALKSKSIRHHEQDNTAWLEHIHDYHWEWREERAWEHEEE